jgi:uncharacterized membrane protein
MTQHFKTTLSALALSVFAIGGVAAGVTLISADAAIAKSDNGGGNGSGNAGGNGNGNGGLASELGGLNAAKANPNALKNANPNSQVGKIAAYQEAAFETKDAYSEWQDAYADYLAHKDSYSGPSSEDIQDQLDAANATNADLDEQISDLDPADPDYEGKKSALEDQKVDTAGLESDLATATEYETKLDELTEASNAAGAAYEEAQGAEAEALDTAAGGRDLSDAAVEELRDTLGL